MTENPEKLNNQAIILAAGGSYNEAIACFKRAIVIQKNNYLLWYNLGVTYRDAGKLGDAKNALAMAYKIAPENDDVVETYATIALMQGQLHEVAHICEEGLDLNPLNSHLWNLMGVANFQAEDYEEAAEFFEQAVSINPYYLDALYNLRDTYSILENKSGEAECDKKIREIEK